MFTYLVCTSTGVCVCFQLPQHAQWASSNVSPTHATNNQGHSLQQIQQIEAEKSRHEQNAQVSQCTIALPANNNSLYLKSTGTATMFSMGVVVN